MEALDGLPPVKVHCSVLAEQAIKAAVADYYTRQGIDPTPIVGKIEDCDHHDHCGCGEQYYTCFLFYGHISSSDLSLMLFSTQ